MAISKMTAEEIRRKAESGIPLDNPTPEKLKAYNTYQSAYSREVIKKAQSGAALESPNAWKNDLYAANVPVNKITPLNKNGNIVAPQKIGNGATHVVVGENIKTVYDIPTWNSTMTGLGTDKNGKPYGENNPAPGYSADDYRQDMYGVYTDYLVQNNKIQEYPGIYYEYKNGNYQLPTPQNVYVPQPYVPPKPRQKPPTQPGLKPTFAFEEQKQVTKYEYLQGIRNISITSEEYAPKSIYVTKPIQVPGNIVEVSLTSKESHPIFDEVTSEASSRQTSVEYYISYEENPALEDWHAILPEDQKEVLAELLLFGSGAADLRFTAVATKEGLQQARVYKDGVLIEKSKWSFANGGRQIQLLEGYSPASIYTIDYTPNASLKNPWVVSIIQDQLKKIRQVDQFPHGTNRNKTVVLSNYPYVNYELINQEADYDANASTYKPVIVRLTNATIAGVNRSTFKEVSPIDTSTTQDIFTKNTTNYKTGEWKTLKPYSLKADDRYKGFDYWHERNKLYFSETFNKADIQANLETNHGNGTIEVEYEYLVSSFRVKIILRRNGAGMNSITPVVHSYALKFKSMN